MQQKQKQDKPPKSTPYATSQHSRPTQWLPNSKSPLNLNFIFPQNWGKGAKRSHPPELGQGGKTLTSPRIGARGQNAHIPQNWGARGQNAHIPQNWGQGGKTLTSPRIGGKGAKRSQHLRARTGKRLILQSFWVSRDRSTGSTRSPTTFKEKGI